MSKLSDNLASKVASQVVEMLTESTPAPATQVSAPVLHHGCGGELIPHYPDNPDSRLLRCDRCGVVGYAQ